MIMANQEISPGANGDSPDQAKHSMRELPAYSIRKLTDPRTSTLAQCLRTNHASYTALRDPMMLLHNHMPHILGSAYYLGASSAKLHQVTRVEGETLRSVAKAPIQEALTQDTWRQHWGDKNYTLAFAKFFDDEFKKAGGDWQRVAEELLYSTSRPLADGLSGGLGHPWIHLHYAYEYDSQEVASEALSLAATEYDPMHKYFESPPPPSKDTSTTQKNKNAEEILLRTRQDKRFDVMGTVPGFENWGKIHAQCEDTFLEYWNSLIVDEEDIDETQFEELFDLSARLAVETGDSSIQYDFFYIHLLTVAHGLRFIFPYVPKHRRSPMLKLYWAWMIQIYCAQIRLPIAKGTIESFDLKQDVKWNWDWVCEQAVTDQYSNDAHYVKVIRALRVGEEVYGEKNGFYLKAAVKFVTQFSGWTGFGNFDPTTH